MNLKFIFLVLIATVIGEVVLVLLTTVAQEVLVDGVHLKTSSNGDLILGGGATLLAGVITGFIVSLIVGKANKIAHILISILISLESTYLILSNKVSGPLWFDVLSAILLIASIWLGYSLYMRVKR